MTHEEARKVVQSILEVQKFVPYCKKGYCVGQVKKIVGESKLQEFWEWFGDSWLECECRLCHIETEEFDQCCGGISHGLVVPTEDVETFLLSLLGDWK